MSNEKWSEWFQWAQMPRYPEPVKPDTIVQIKNCDGDTLTADYEGRDIEWREVIAYRYKIKEPESDMHPDLEWLARSLKSWPWCVGNAIEMFAGTTGEYLYDPNLNTVNGYFEKQWQAARQQLGLDQLEVTEAEEEAWQAKERELMPAKYSAYFKDVRHIDNLDVYRVVSLFDCEKHGHPISHAAKKLLLSGSRTGGKDVESDVREAIDTLHRWLEMREEDSRAL